TRWSLLVCSPQPTRFTPPNRIHQGFTMQKTRSRFRSFRLAFGAAAVAGVFALVGCFPTDDKDDKKDPADYVVRSVLRDTGIAVFSENCQGCHGEFGEGTRAPRVANSDFFMNNRARVIEIVLGGNTEPITVNGVAIEGGGMPAWGDMLSDLQIAGVLTYIRTV